MKKYCMPYILGDASKENEISLREREYSNELKSRFRRREIYLNVSSPLEEKLHILIY